MKFCDWCHLAQDEQIFEEKSTLYANLGHTRYQTLISSSGLEKFTDCLAQVDDSTLHCPPDQDFGKSNLAIQSAIDQAYNTSLSSSEDFRLAGKIVHTDEILINLLYGPYQPRPFRPSGGTPGILWLTQFSKFVSYLEKSVNTSGDKFSRQELFKDLVCSLGLKPRIGVDFHWCTIRVFEKATENKTKRPHVFSTGYPDKFCGVSPYQPWGSTADNRTGKAGLPELISFAQDTIESPPGTSKYEEVRSALSSFVNFDLGNGYINIEMLVRKFHDADNDIQFRKQILKRLSPEGKNKHCPSPGIGACKYAS